MEILHLTDLHVTQPNTSLEEVWTTASETLRVVRREKFDFIVVSGDLTQQAAANEYDRLAEFATKQLVPRLRKPDERRRIVFVPGNHDVAWSQPIGTRFGRWSPPSGDDVNGYLANPGQSALRYRFRPRGKVEFWRRDPSSYVRRFEQLQKFLNEFYGKELEAPHRSFRLLSERAKDHWSAHVFRDEGVAFFGFNTCFHNDGFWRGATLEVESVVAAAAHGRTHAADLLWIAVWHHGLTSDRGQPDHLLTRDLGYLRFNNFRVGIHGHTHTDEFGDLRQLLGERFPVVATGSFAAGPTERPEGTLNQFAILEIGPSYLCVERYEREATTQWKRHKPPPYVLRVADVEEELFNEVESHARTFQLDLATGNAVVRVEMTALDAHREVVLAEPHGPYSNLIYDPHAIADGAQIDVYESDAGDGRRRLKLAGHRSYDSLRWNCTLSNVLARDRADIAMRTPDGLGDRLRRTGWEEYDWIANTVRIHARTLVLAVEAKGDLEGAFFEPEHVGLRVFDEKDIEREDEGSRSKPLVAADGRSVNVKIARPYLGYRYVLGYRPRPAGYTYPTETLMLISNVADTLREGLPDDPARNALNHGIEQGLRDALGISDPEERLIWYGYLWHHGQRRLLTAFGNAPWSAAGTDFEYGRGVVGHAFRTCRPASFFATKQAASLLLVGETDFDWIVSVPLLLDVTGPAVGVIGFAGRDMRGWDRDLRAYAQRAAAQADGGLKAFEERLLNGVTLPFWNELRHVVKNLSESDRVEYMRIYGAWRARVKG